MKRVVAAPYHPEANAQVKRGHTQITNLLAKLCKNEAEYKRYLPQALLADRISTQQMSGYSPYKLLYGCRPVLPIDVREGTWIAIEWEKVKTREELLEARMQLTRHPNASSECTC